MTTAALATAIANGDVDSVRRQLRHHTVISIDTLLEKVARAPCWEKPKTMTQAIHLVLDHLRPDVVKTLETSVRLGLVDWVDAVLQYHPTATDDVSAEAIKAAVSLRAVECLESVATARQTQAERLLALAEEALTGEEGCHSLFLMLVR